MIQRGCKILEDEGDAEDDRARKRRGVRAGNGGLDDHDDKRRDAQGGTDAWVIELAISSPNVY